MKAKKKGFTLVEIIVVVLVISIISFIAIPNIINLRNTANNAKLEKKIQMIKLAAENYALNNKNNILKECENGSASCQACPDLDNCYTYSINSQKLVDLNYLEETTDDSPEVKVVFSGDNYSNIKSSIVRIKRLKENAVKLLYSLAKDGDEGSIETIEAENDEITCTNTLAYDGTDDNSLRYVGLNPCNYVTFNDEKAGWRIIGAIKNVDDGTGKKETRLKLVRAKSIGTYSWNASGISGTNGINDWSEGKLMTELNNDFLSYDSEKNSLWYVNWQDDLTGTYNHSQSLKPEAQNYIKDAVWYLGSTSTCSITVDAFYAVERGDDVYSGRSTSWTGKVGLIYPSDVGYAVDDTVGGTESRVDCINDVNLFERRYYSCKANYLGARNGSASYVSGYTITPRKFDNGYGARSVFMFNDSIVTSNLSQATSVNPVVYLKSSVMIVDGNGSAENPYQLSLS